MRKNFRFTLVAVVASVWMTGPLLAHHVPGHNPPYTPPPPSSYKDVPTEIEPGNDPAPARRPETSPPSRPREEERPSYSKPLIDLTDPVTLFGLQLWMDQQNRRR